MCLLMLNTDKDATLLILDKSNHRVAIRQNQIEEQSMQQLPPMFKNVNSIKDRKADKLFQIK